MTQVQRVEQLLRRRGSRGVCLADFLPPATADGGGPITRLGARIADLRESGRDIVTEGTRDGFAVYVLREKQRVAASAPAETTASAEQATLLGDTPRSAVLGWEDAA
jgi:hypothetical protein